MPSLARLTRRSEFLRTASARKKWVTPGVIVQARARQPGEALAAGGDDDRQARIGLTVSRKVGNAVQRNRARRRLRALARDLLPEMGRPGTDYVFIGRRATPTRPAADLRSDVATALRRVNAQVDGTSKGRRRPRRGTAAPAGGTETSA